MSNDLKIQTGKFIYGSWIWEGKGDGFNKSILISIDEKQVIINWLIAGICKNTKTFSSNAHWFGDYLNFIEGQVYYVKGANEEKMVFGEFEIAGVIGVSKWEKEFVRMKEN